MSLVGNNQQIDPQDNYPKGDNGKSKVKLANQQVKLYDDYRKPYASLNDRIKNLTQSLAKGELGLFQVETFFHKELREINASTGNEKIQKNLLKLKDKINERFNTKESHELAFQIQCTAQGLTPGFKVKELPTDVQDMIFYAFGSETRDLEGPYILEKDSNNTSAAIRGMIDANHISLKRLGCRNAKEAVQYVITHKPKSANLSEFPDLVDADLEELCQKCPHLEVLSIKSYYVGKRSVIALGKLDNLQSLDVSLCSKLSGNELIAMLENKTHLKSLNVLGCEQLPGDKFIKMLEKLTHLQNLSIVGCRLFPEEEFIKALEKLVTLESLDISGCDQLSASVISSKFPHLKVLFY